MYQDPNALPRADIMAVVNESAAADTYFIGPIVFPPLFQKRDTGEFQRITKAASKTLKKQNVTVRAPKGEYGKVDRTFAKDSYLCVDRGLEELIDDNDRKRMNNYFDLETATANLVRRGIQFDHENRVAGKVFNESNFDAEDAEVDYTAANLATIDFPTDMNAALRRVRSRGEFTNTAIFNRELWDLIRMSPILAKYLFGNLGGGQQITPEEVAKAFGLKQVLVADATWDTSAHGQDEEPTYIWPNTHFWVGNVQGGDFTAGGAGRTIIWSDAAPALFQVQTYRAENRKSDVVRVFQHTDEKVISNPAGTLVVTGAE